MTTSGWIGVDLDGTLAHYDGWNGGGIGEPIEEMVVRVREWITNGVEVRIFTARVGVGSAGFSEESGASDTQAFADFQRSIIETWCLRHIGTVLKVTAQKDFAMMQLWDDRAIQVGFNTGIPVSGSVL